MKNPFFSIVIPTFNQAKLLKVALDSIYLQSFKNYEIIIIDNYSNDKTSYVLKNFKKKIKIKKIKNKGIIAKSRNLGIKLSRGKWICFLDSDDYWLPQKLESIFKLINTKKCDVVCHSEKILDNSQKNKKVWLYGPYTKNFYATLLKKGNRLSTSASTVNRKFINKNNIIFDENKKFVTAEDYSFFLNIANCGGKFYFENKPLGFHLLHSKSASSNEDKHFKATENVIKHHIFKIQSFEKDKNKLWKIVYNNFLFRKVLLTNKYDSFFTKLKKLFFSSLKFSQNEFEYLILIFYKKIRSIYFNLI